MRPLRRSRRTTTNTTSRESKSVPDKYNEAFAVLDEVTHPGEGKKCEIHMYERRFNSRGEPIFLQSGSRSELGFFVTRSIEAALVLTKYYSIKNELDITQLEIKSPHIREALKKVVQSYPGVNINSSGPILIPGDPMCLFHYRDELQNYASKVQNIEAKEHVIFLLQYMTKALRKEIVSYEELMENNDVPPGLEFENLWMAFKPGTLLYENDKGSDIICRLRDVRRVRPYMAPPHWSIDTEMIYHDGKNFRFVPRVREIKKFDGYRPLTEFEIFPLEYHENQKTLRTKLRERGKQYIKYLGHHHCMYEGIAELNAFYGRGTQAMVSCLTNTLHTTY